MTDQHDAHNSQWCDACMAHHAGPVGVYVCDRYDDYDDDDEDEDENDEDDEDDGIEHRSMSERDRQALIAFFNRHPHHPGR